MGYIYIYIYCQLICVFALYVRRDPFRDEEIIRSQMHESRVLGRTLMNHNM